MHIKRMHEMIESLTACTKEAIECEQICVGKYPIGDVVDMIKDLSEAEYYALIAKAMKESEEEEESEEKELLRRLKEEYGEDEGERRFYRARNARGQFMTSYRNRGRRAYEEMTPYFHMLPPYEYPDMSSNRTNARDIDLHDGRMYTSDRPSKYGYTHDAYMDVKRKHPGQDEESERKRMEKLDECLDDIEDMAKEMVAGMTQKEKQAWKVKLNKLINM